MRSAPVNMEQVAKLLTSSGPCLLFLRSAEDKQRPRCEEQGSAQPQQPSPSSPAQQPSPSSPAPAAQPAGNISF